MQIKFGSLKRHMKLCNSDIRKQFGKIHCTTQINYEKQSEEMHGATYINYAKKGSPQESWHGTTQIIYEKVATGMMAQWYTN